MIRFRSMLIAFALLLSAASGTWAFDRVVERAVLVDTEGTLSISDVVGMDFKPAGRIVSNGYTPAATWLRVTIGPVQGASRIILRVRPTYLDEVTLYSEQTDGEWKAQVSGDKTPFAQRPLATIHPGFMVLPSPDVETVYYLRLQTTSTSLLSVQALTPADAQVAELWSDLFQVVNFVVLGCIVLWALQELMARRERVIALFLASEVLFIFYDFAIMGYLSPLLSNQTLLTPDLVTSILVCVTPLVSLAFHRQLVAPFAPHAFALRTFDALMVLIGIALLLVVVGRVQAGLQLNAVATLMAAPVFVALAFSARRDGLPGRAVLRVTYGAQAASLVISMVPILGLVDAIEWNLHATLIHGVISAGLMFFLLHRRSVHLRTQGLQAAIDLIFARQQLDLERQQRDVQDRFVAMLTHELKTPLSVVRLATGMAGTSGEPKRLIDTALVEMTALVDRCAYASRLDQDQMEVRKIPCDVREAIAAASGGSDARRLNVSVDPVPAVTCDPPLLGVMLANLIDNALKYSGDGTAVEVTARPAVNDGADGVSIFIDSVPGRAGMPDPERVFEKFYRAPGAHRKVGSGLGLYIVRGVAELTGSQVKYEPTAGKVRFRLWLPC